MILKITRRGFKGVIKGGVSRVSVYHLHSLVPGACERGHVGGSFYREYVDTRSAAPVPGLRGGASLVVVVVVVVSAGGACGGGGSGITVNVVIVVINAVVVVVVVVVAVCLCVHPFKPHSS